MNVATREAASVAAVLVARKTAGSVFRVRLPAGSATAISHVLTREQPFAPAGAPTPLTA
jgi:hypothetical protein